MDLVFRNATSDDLQNLVALLANDELGSQREDQTFPLNQQYFNAFNEIKRDKNNSLIIAEHEGSIVGMLQLTFIPYLTHIGSWRCLIEGVRVHEDARGKGIGKQLFQYAIAQAKKKNCRMVQLTTDKSRPDAIRFYEKLGFTASHEGFKMIFE
ncbi:MAG: GNAT family N-acetyltransferase [Kangiellaceae bacterium]|jgi:ribosomal protein S18 acetylase RimI-like enzyme|nr:GNAT family N-acetyltransferase [Kangiellaceae bacterium]